MRLIEQLLYFMAVVFVTVLRKTLGPEHPVDRRGILTLFAG